MNLFTGIALHTYTARITDCICKHAVNMTIQGQAVYVYCTLISVHFCLWRAIHVQKAHNDFLPSLTAKQYFLFSEFPF